MIKSPSATACSIIENVEIYSEEKGKHVNRYKCSVNAFLEMSGHKHVLPVDYAAMVQAELAQRGWLMMYLPNCELGFMAMGATANWTKLSGKRVQTGYDLGVEKSYRNKLAELLKSYDNDHNLRNLHTLYVELSNIRECEEEWENPWYIQQILSNLPFASDNIQAMIDCYDVECEDNSYWGELYSICKHYLEWSGAVSN